jgi:hypothetical protein
MPSSGGAIERCGGLPGEEDCRADLLQLLSTTRTRVFIAMDLLRPGGFDENNGHSGKHASIQQLRTDSLRDRSTNVLRG